MVETNWYTVTAFRQLATHTAEFVDKGDRVLVVGKLRISEWENDERSGANIEIEAEAIGHDLTWAPGSSPARSGQRIRPSPKTQMSRAQ